MVAPQGDSNMMRVTLLVFCLALFAAPALADTKAPTGIAGFSIGADIKEYKAKVDMAEADKEFFRPCLSQAPINPMPGYRSGYLSYGTCQNPGMVVRIKLNYEDDSLDFFNKVLEALKGQYGDPDEWRGNAFGTLRTWKWSMTSEVGDDISLILMYYQGDDGAYTKGNSIRINAYNRIVAEEECYKAKGGDKQAKEDRAASLKKIKDFNWYLPN